MPSRVTSGGGKGPAALDVLLPYPSARAYLARQPAGWNSHPECLASSELFASLRGGGALEGLEDLLVFVKEEQGWVSEVAVMTTLLALKDARFDGAANTAGSDESFMNWMDAMNRPLVVGREPTGGPAASAYRIRDVWARLHRGTPMVVRSVSARGAVVAVQHPRDLWVDVVHEWRRRAFLASLASDGAAQPTAIARTVDTGTDYELGW